jgi:hypothetical protein
VQKNNLVIWQNGAGWLEMSKFHLETQKILDNSIGYKIGFSGLRTLP